MHRQPSTRVIVLLCALAYMAAQLLGLHYHRHVGSGDGMHSGAVAAEHHAHDSLNGAAAHTAGAPHLHGFDIHEAHGGFDVDIGDVADSAAKMFQSLFVPALLLTLLLLAVDSSAWMRRLRPVLSVPPQRSRLFLIRPPSQGPPPALALI